MYSSFIESERGGGQATLRPPPRSQSLKSTSVKFLGALLSRALGKTIRRTRPRPNLSTIRAQQLKGIASNEEEDREAPLRAEAHARLPRRGLRLHLARGRVRDGHRELRRAQAGGDAARQSERRARAGRERHGAAGRQLRDGRGRWEEAESQRADLAAGAAHASAVAADRRRAQGQQVNGRTRRGAAPGRLGLDGLAGALPELHAGEEERRRQRLGGLR